MDPVKERGFSEPEILLTQDILAIVPSPISGKANNSERYMRTFSVLENVALSRHCLWKCKI